MYVYHLYKRYEIRSVKLHLVISTVKFHTQFEEKTVVPNPSDIIFN